MNISGASSAAIQSVLANFSQPNDAVALSVLKKAMDIQASQASQLIASVAGSVPQPQAGRGSIIDDFA